MKNIIFAGDLFLKENSSVTIDKKIVDIFKVADYSLLNLEAPFIKNTRTKKHPKAGPNLCQGKNTISFLQKLRIRYLGSANNHIYDYGEEGLDQTKKILQENSIKYNGFGKNLEEASRTVKFEGVNICFISCCEEEFGIADKNYPGAFSMYGNEIIIEIRKQKKLGNIVIVFAHGGGEEVPIPPEYILCRYKEFIDFGADLVIGHHPHVPQGYENYKSKYIFYSLGNFIHDSFEKYWGFMISANFDDQKMVDFRIIPICLNKSKLSLCTDGKKRIDHLNLLSNVYRDQKNMAKLLQEQSVSMYKSYYEGYLTGMFAKGKDSNNIINDRLLLLHLLRNKSHSEFIGRSLTLLSRETVDLRTLKTKLLFNKLSRIIK
jgi:hypothetical protein